MNRLTIVFYRLGLYNPIVMMEFVAVALVAAAIDALGTARRERVRTAVAGAINAIAQRKQLAVAVAALVPMLIRAALLPVYPAPAPAIHDEFSNILLADTFLQGRLANPPHPFAEHFETFQSLQSPTYSSFRPPGPGLLIAVGKLFGGSDWTGVWLGAGLMCGGICWMLQGWLPPLWALAGALLAGIQIGVLSYWMNSYWGGSLAATGGAIAMGALGRIWRAGPRPQFSFALGVGAALLALVRPFEGALFCAGIGIVLATLARRWTLEKVVGRTLVPLTAVGALLVGWLMVYNTRVTNNPMVFPYQLGVQRNNMAPSFVWDHEDTSKQYSNEHLRRFHVDSEMHLYRGRQKVGRWWLYAMNLAHIWQFFVRPALTVPLLAGLALIWRTRKMVAMALPAAVTIAAMPLANWHNPHYVAAITGIIYGFVAQGLRRMWLYRDKKGQKSQRSYVFAAPLVCVATLVIATALEVRGNRLDHDSQGWAGNAAQWPERQALSRLLLHKPGKHLVFVRYKPEHDFEREWVQNAADIDKSRIVWARELDATRNDGLIRYMRDRQVWRLEADAQVLAVVPYAGFSQATVR